MRVYVCIKHVPDTEARIEPKNGNTINKDGVKWVMSPYDEYAVEESIKLKEKEPDTEVVVVSYGPEKAVETIRKALAMGADRALHIVGDTNLDYNLTATALANAIKADGEPDIVFMGKQAIDDDGFQVHIRTAYKLNASVATNVTAFTYEGGSVKVVREIEEGAKESIDMTLPAVVAVTKGINTPRYPSLPNIMKAKRKEVKTLTCADVGVDEDLNQQEIVSITLPEEKPGGMVISGEPAETVPKLVALLRDEAKVL